jgi:hypothetical protein
MMVECELLGLANHLQTKLCRGISENQIMTTPLSTSVQGALIVAWGHVPHGCHGGVMLESQSNMT